MNCRFSQVIVIGCGKIAGDVLRYVAERQMEYEYTLTFIEHETHTFSSFEEACQHLGVGFELIIEKNALTERLMGISESTLIVSAGNYYLFPQEVISKKNFEIINFHNALLPAYPGRNAQTWAIFMGETVTGATWHYVTTEVDNGAIIAQSRVLISGDIKAYELTKSIMDVAFESFTCFYESLLKCHLEGKSQPSSKGKRKIYYSREIPNGGVCKVTDDPTEIYRLLRAVDYGKSDIFPPVRITFPNGTRCQVVRYAKKENAHTDGRSYVLEQPGNRLFLPLPDGSELAIRLK